LVLVVAAGAGAVRAERPTAWNPAVEDGSRPLPVRVLVARPLVHAQLETARGTKPLPREARARIVAGLQAALADHLPRHGFQAAWADRHWVDFDRLIGSALRRGGGGARAPLHAPLGAVTPRQAERSRYTVGDALHECGETTGAGAVLVPQVHVNQLTSGMEAGFWLSPILSLGHGIPDRGKREGMALVLWLLDVESGDVLACARAVSRGNAGRHPEHHAARAVERALRDWPVVADPPDGPERRAGR
jgi:hypothetical protein